MKPPTPLSRIFVDSGLRLIPDDGASSFTPTVSECIGVLIKSPAFNGIEEPSSNVKARVSRLISGQLLSSTVLYLNTYSTISPSLPALSTGSIVSMYSPSVRRPILRNSSLPSNLSIGVSFFRAETTTLVCMARKLIEDADKLIPLPTSLMVTWILSIYHSSPG